MNNIVGILAVVFAVLAAVFYVAKIGFVVPMLIAAVICVVIFIIKRAQPL